MAELALAVQSLPVLLAKCPRGESHPVLVLPGFMASDSSTVFLRSFLRRLGYKPEGWGQGRNKGPTPRVEIGMLHKLQKMFYRSGQKVSIVGWSLGGIFAREVARQRPEMVRQVITLGSPFGGAPQATNVWRLFELVSGKSVDETAAQFSPDLTAPPEGVPSTAVYSHGDGIAAWQVCREVENDLTDNVRVPGSHCGLGHNPWAMYIVADRLAQDLDAWKPFDRSGLRKLVFPRSVDPD